MTLRAVREVLSQTQELGTVQSIYFEGGEPFLYYALLVRAVREAVALGFRVGIVSNAYWAEADEDAEEWLRPFAGLVVDLSISHDLYHCSDQDDRRAQIVARAARRLGIPLGVISIAQPTDADAAPARGTLPPGVSAVMYRGRAAEQLAPRASAQSWNTFTACPYEDLREPGRVHIDPLGYVHICQGIALGNVFETPLREICARYDPAVHPITGPLLRKGPRALFHKYALSHADVYADACHACYEARKALRPSFPDILTPDQMYAVIGST
jgi:MoaA/NifB/PqqE/SkfB family radical SAM enzyme